MHKLTTFGKILQVIGFILLGLTVTVTLLGGIGSSCAAFAAEKFESMLELVPYKWLYQLLVVLTLAAGVYGCLALSRLIRGKKEGYRDALIAVLASLILAAVQMTASQMLRGKSMPNDMRVYVSGLTLVIFLVYRLPPIWRAVAGFRRDGTTSGSTGVGLSLFLSGVTVLTVHLWAGPTHTWGGVNYADVWHYPLTLAGWVLAAAGLERILASTLALKGLPWGNKSHQVAR